MMLVACCPMCQLAAIHIVQQCLPAVLSTSEVSIASHKWLSTSAWCNEILSFAVAAGVVVHQRTRLLMADLHERADGTRAALGRVRADKAAAAIRRAQRKVQPTVVVVQW